MLKCTVCGIVTDAERILKEPEQNLTDGKIKIRAVERPSLLTGALCPHSETKGNTAMADRSLSYNQEKSCKLEDDSFMSM